MQFNKITDNKKKEIYTRMWENNSMVNGVVNNTPYKDGYSENSYIFSVGDVKNKKALLKKVFDIKDNLFDEKYDQACNGSGNEERKIMTLHSSSLCALLFFYSVSDDHPLIMNVDGKETRFTDSVFEYQNCVTDNGAPSNMDITLLGTAEGHRVILFLESKFSEYIINIGRKLEVANKYLNTKYSDCIYDEEKCDLWNKLNIKIKRGADKFELDSMNSLYLEGLKQMISHYVGVRRFADKEYANSKDSKKQKLQEKVRNYVDSTTSIYLGSILFEDKIGQIKMNKELTYLQNYSKAYGILADCLNEQIIKDRVLNIKVLNKLFLYGDMFNNNQAKSHEFLLNPKMREFYFS